MLARHGLLPVAVTVVAALATVAVAGQAASVPVWLLALLLAWLFRDPERDIPSSPLSVVAPADGRLVEIGKTDDPYLKRASLRFRINMSPLGVYTTRSPVEGKVLEPPGDSAEAGQPHGVWLQTDEGDDIVLAMNRGRLNATPRCYVRFGERTGQGSRCGFLQWGGQVDIYLPEYARPKVEVGSQVRAGTDVIASLVHD